MLKIWAVLKGVMWDGICKLLIPNPPTVAVSTNVIAEDLKSQSISNNIPAVPTVGVSAVSVDYTEISGVSISIASPCVVTKAGHGITNHESIKFTTTGALPTGLTALTYYYCDYIDADTFSITSTIGGANINTSGSQSGTQSVWHVA